MCGHNINNKCWIKHWKGVHSVTRRNEMLALKPNQYPLIPHWLEEPTNAKVIELADAKYGRYISETRIKEILKFVQSKKLIPFHLRFIAE